MTRIVNGNGGYGEGVVLYPVTLPLFVPGRRGLLWMPAYLILWVLPE